MMLNMQLTKCIQTCYYTILFPLGCTSDAPIAELRIGNNIFVSYKQYRTIHAFDARNTNTTHTIGNAIHTL